MTSPSPVPTSMPPPLPSLTLIVATTPSLGIGLRGSLPWPALKTDLAFFARVTKRVPPSSQSRDADTNAATAQADHLDVAVQDQSATSNGQTVRAKNAVIMGRKTWESIPPRFRPLKERINVVVTRDPEKLRSSLDPKSEEVLVAGSLHDALGELSKMFSPGKEGVKAGQQSSTKLGRAFIVGGAEIYKLALGMRECERVLWTRLKGEWECDTFFPEGVLEYTESPKGYEGEVKEPENAWTRCRGEDLEAWTGEDGASGGKKDGDVEYEVFMLERTR